MRALGIDFGERRIGLAVSDAEGRFALPHSILARTSDAAAVEEIAALAAREEIAWIAVGEARGKDGARGPAAERARRFAGRVAARTGLPVEMVDETLTSREAAARLRDAGVGARKSKARLDAVAAQLLLQEALDRRRGAQP